MVGGKGSLLSICRSFWRFWAISIKSLLPSLLSFWSVWRACFKNLLSSSRALNFCPISETSFNIFSSFPSVPEDLKKKNHQLKSRKHEETNILTKGKRIAMGRGYSIWDCISWSIQSVVLLYGTIIERWLHLRQFLAGFAEELKEKVTLGLKVSNLKIGWTQRVSFKIWRLSCWGCVHFQLLPITCS